MVGFSTQSASAEKVLASEYQATPQVSLSQSIKDVATIATASTQTRADEEGEWVKVSTGIWFEGPMAARYTDVDEGQWDVDIYQNEAQPGVIRLNPYGEGTPLATLLGSANTVDLDINVADPTKCYFLDWAPWGNTNFMIGSICAENGFSGGGYGTLTDGVVEFASGTFYYYYNKNYYSHPGTIKIVLDKETYVDYSLTANASFCGTPSELYINLTKGDGIATVKVMALEGEYPMNDNNAQVIASSGIDFTSYCGKNVTLGLDGTNQLWSVLYVGLDADGAIKAQGAIYQYSIEDDAANWKSLGEATFTEGFLSEFFSDVDSETLTCEIEENINTPCYYRLVNPYAGSQFAANEEHNHYLYINATDPEKVYVEPSAIGAYINKNFGYVAVQSWGYYLGEGTTADNYNVWGTMADGVIAVPAFRMQLSAYNGGAYLNITSLPVTEETANPFKVVFPALAPPENDIEGVSEDGAVELKDGQEITLTAGEGEDIYFAWEEVKAEEDSQALAAQKHMPADEDFVILPAEAEGKVIFEAENDGDQKYLHYYAKNPTTGAKSPITSILITRNGSTGVENVNAASEAPVEYFNLQGIRIDNPADGQVVIRRQGNTVTKIVK